MTIWVDADACPRVIRDILFRAAERCAIPLTLVANQSIEIPRSRHIRMLQVSSGFDVADNEIALRIEPGDLLITADIPLAAEAVEKQAQVLSPRGERFTPDNIRERLNMRDFMDTMRSSGFTGGGPPPLSATDRQAFANGLDSYLARLSTQ
ncbi:MAG: YaiI/YqxD family protein [Sedimenticolaceae bacterium]